MNKITSAELEKRRAYQREWERKNKRPDRYSKEKRKEVNQANYKNNYIRSTMPNYALYLDKACYYEDRNGKEICISCEEIRINQHGCFVYGGSNHLVNIKNVRWHGEK